MAYGDSNDDSGTDPRASSRPTEADGAMSGTDPRASARPTRADERASARPPEDADVGTVGDEPGLLERVGSAASSLGSRVSDAAGDALEPSQSGGDSTGSLLGMGSGNDSTAFDRLGDDRDRSSSLFEMGDGGGGNDTTAFDRLGDDDDTTAQERLNRLSEAEDSEDLYG